MLRRRPFVGVSTKAYFSAAQTRQWVSAIVENDLISTVQGIDVVIFPSFPFLMETSELLGNTTVKLGAQDVAPSESGAQTGEVLASVLAEINCTYCEVGHAERRNVFGESDSMIADKVAMVTAQGITPLLCVGEKRKGSPQEAALECSRQIKEALRLRVPEDLLVAYEPIWAIGAEKPASTDYISTVGEGIRRQLGSGFEGLRLVYGGAAGPGLITDLSPSIDGLFLGRMAHDVAAFAKVIGEVQQRTVQ